MMWYSNGDVGWGGWALMVSSMIVFWGLLIWGIYTLVRASSGGGKPEAEQSPQQRLAHRFAAGEIDADAYRRDLEVLSNRGPTAS